MHSLPNHGIHRGGGKHHPFYSPLSQICHTTITIVLRTVTHRVTIPTPKPVGKLCFYVHNSGKPVAGLCVYRIWYIGRFRDIHGYAKFSSPLCSAFTYAFPLLYGRLQQIGNGSYPHCAQP